MLGGDGQRLFSFCSRAPGVSAQLRKLSGEQKCDRDAVGMSERSGVRLSLDS